MELFWTLVSYPEHSLGGGSYPSAEVQSVYSPASADWVHFRISVHFSSIQPIDRALSDTSFSGQSGPGSNSNAVVLHIPQNFNITGTSSSVFLLSYLGHSLWGRCILQLQPIEQGVSVFRILHFDSGKRSLLFGIESFDFILGILFIFFLIYLFTRF